jgi:hypothetical protein
MTARVLSAHVVGIYPNDLATVRYSTCGGLAEDLTGLEGARASGRCIASQVLDPDLNGPALLRMDHYHAPLVLP